MTQLKLFDAEKELSKNSLLKYVGGKYYWRDDLIKFVPSGLSECVSPFVGGGHMEVLMSSMGFTMHCGDIYKPLVYAWNVLLESPELIAEEMERLVPARENHIEIRRRFFEAEDKDEDWREIGILFYMALKVSYNGIIGVRTPTGSLQGELPTKRMKPKVIADKIRKFHAPRMTVSLSDYRELMDKHPGVFSYMDPPYKIEYNLYGSDGETHESFDHDDYADYVLARDAPWLISYNDDEWLRERYRDCHIVTLHGRYQCMGKTRKVTELLITKGLNKDFVDGVAREVEAKRAAEESTFHDNIPDLFEDEEDET